MKLLNLFKRWWQIATILLICVTTVLLFIYEIMGSKWTTITLEYEETGTMQFQAQLEYVINGEKKIITEDVEEFSVQFVLEKRLANIDEVLLRLGDQSGTVKIEQVIIEDSDKKAVLNGDEILDVFSLNNVYSSKQENGYLEIFTYDISLSEMEMNLAENEYYKETGRLAIWQCFLIISVCIWLVTICISKYCKQIIRAFGMLFATMCRMIGRMKRRLINVNRWSRISLLTIFCITIILFVYDVVDSNRLTITMKYEETGTTQFQTQLEYEIDGEREIITEDVNDFSVQFVLDNKLTNIDEVMLRLGDQSGTVRIEQVIVETSDGEVVLDDEELLNYFTINTVYSCEQKYDYLEIYTYDITQSEMQMDMTRSEYFYKETTLLATWQYFVIVSVCIWLIAIVVVKNISIIKKSLQCIKKRLVAVNIQNVVCIALIALVCCIAFSDLVGDFVFNNMTRYANVKVGCSYLIKEEGGESPKILDNYSVLEEDYKEEKEYGFYDITQLKAAIVEMKNVRVVSSEESESGYSYFELQTDDSYIVFNLPVYPNTCLSISAEDNRQAVIINSDINDNKRIVAYENTIDVSNVIYYVFGLSDYAYIFIAYICVYLVLFILLCVFISGFVTIAKKFFHSDGFWNKYSPQVMFWVIFGLYFLFTATTYYFNQEKLQVGSETDAYYYMNPQMFDEKGKFSLEILANYLYSFRGYFTIVVAVLAEMFSSVTGLQMIYFYFIFYGALIALTMSVSMPLLYKYFTNKQATNVMSLLTYILFFVFWRNTFYFAMGDIPAAMCAICAMAFALNYLENYKYRSMIIAGLFMGVAISYRTAYTYVFYFIFLWMAVSLFKKVIKKEIKLRNIVIGMVCLLIAIYGVAIPQFVLNYARGHVGFFPYDDGWRYDINSAEIIPLAWSSFTNGFSRYGLFPPETTDQQLLNIYQPYYENKYMLAGDLLYIVFTNPLQFLLGYFKRLFYAMSVAVEGMYGTLYMSEMLTNLVKIFNYVLLGNFAYVLTKNREKEILSAKGKWFCFLYALSTIFIQNLSHIERRYYLCYFLLIYFINGFLCLNYLKEHKQEGNIVRYFIKMLLFVLGCMILNATIRSNFV